MVRSFSPTKIRAERDLLLSSFLVRRPDRRCTAAQPATCLHGRPERHGTEATAGPPARGRRPVAQPTPAQHMAAAWGAAMLLVSGSAPAASKVHAQRNGCSQGAGTPDAYRRAAHHLRDSAVACGSCNAGARHSIQPSHTAGEGLSSGQWSVRACPRVRPVSKLPEALPKHRPRLPSHAVPSPIWQVPPCSPF